MKDEWRWDPKQTESAKPGPAGGEKGRMRFHIWVNSLWGHSRRVVTSCKPHSKLHVCSFFINPLSPICVVQLLLGVRPSPLCDWYTLYTSKEGWLSLSQQLLNANSPLPRGGTSGLPPLLCVDFVWFVFVQTCVCYDNQYELTCTTALFCPENSVSLKPFITSGSCRLSVMSFSTIPEYCGERCDTDIPFRAEPFLVSYSLHVGQLWVMC